MDEFKQERLEQIRSNVIKVDDDDCFSVGERGRLLVQMQAKEFEKCTEDSFSKFMNTYQENISIFLYFQHLGSTARFRRQRSYDFILKIIWNRLIAKLITSD